MPIVQAIEMMWQAGGPWSEGTVVCAWIDSRDVWEGSKKKNRRQVGRRPEERMAQAPPQELRCTPRVRRRRTTRSRWGKSPPRNGGLRGQWKGVHIESSQTATKRKVRRPLYHRGRRSRGPQTWWGTLGEEGQRTLPMKGGGGELASTRNVVNREANRRLPPGKDNKLEVKHRGGPWFSKVSTQA